MSSVNKTEAKPSRKQILGLMILYVAGIAFFSLTNPDELPLFVLIIPFLYIFGVLYLTILFVCRFMSLRSSGLVSLIISIFGVLLFVLGSLHQLTVRDVIISLALTFILTWYVMRITGRGA